MSTRRRWGLGIAAKRAIASCSYTARVGIEIHGEAQGNNCAYCWRQQRHWPYDGEAVRQQRRLRFHHGRREAEFAPAVKEIGRNVTAVQGACRILKISL